MIINVFSVPPSHLALQMEIAVREFPWYDEPQMNIYSRIFPRQIMMTYFSQPFLQPILLRDVIFSLILFHIFHQKSSRDLIPQPAERVMGSWRA